MKSDPFTTKHISNKKSRSFSKCLSLAGRNLKIEELLGLALFIILLFLPMVFTFTFIWRGNPDVLLRDVLFIEGVLLLIFGAQSGEYIWRFIRSWRKMKKEGSYPTELEVGLALLAVGTVYVAVGMFFPAGILA